VEKHREVVENFGHPGTLAYNWFFYSQALRGVLRKHKVKFTQPRYGRDDKYVFSAASRKRWYELFAVPEEIEVPFTYYDYSRAVGFMKVIEGLGVNFRHILHLKSELRFYRYLKPGEHYVIDYVFDSVVRIKEDKAAIIGYTDISRNGERCLSMRDHFAIKEVPPRYASRLKFDESQEFRGITRLPANPLQDCGVKEIYIPKTLAQRYGSVSGDKNIVHTSATIAKLFGYERPFIQGLCTANLIMRELCVAGLKLEHFSITFCLPVFMDSVVYLQHNDHEYRLSDVEGKVLCFGRINQ